MPKHRGARSPKRVDRLVGQLRRELAGLQRHEGRPVDLHQPLVGGAAPFDLRQREEIVDLLQQCIAQLGETPTAFLG
jgi:hypothetical protein